MLSEIDICDAAPMVKESGVPEAKRAPSKYRILIVEDDPDMCALILDTLTEAGLIVDGAGDGIEGRRLASLNRYDVVVSDVRLPGLNGIELARQLLAREHPPRVILITAYPDAQTVMEGYAVGAQHVIPKPVSLRNLAHLVRSSALESGKRIEPSGPEGMP